MGLFSSVANAQVSQGGIYFLPGKYRIKIVAAKVVRSHKNKDFFVGECEILESNVSKLPVGTRASQVIDISNLMGPGNIKAFVAAASGVNPSDGDINEQLVAKWLELTGEEMDIEQICERVVMEDNPLADIEMLLTVVEITTKDGRPFNKHTWAPAE